MTKKKQKVWWLKGPGQVTLCKERTTCFRNNEILEPGSKIGILHKKKFCLSCYIKVKAILNREVNAMKHPYGRMTQ